MKLAKVVGKVTGTVKANRLGGVTILMVDFVDADGAVSSKAEVVVDQLGAGVGDWVLVTTGSGARQATSASLPIDAAVVMIVDEVTSGSTSPYKSSASPDG